MSFMKSSRQQTADNDDIDELPTQPTADYETPINNNPKLIQIEIFKAKRKTAIGEESFNKNA